LRLQRVLRARAAAAHSHFYATMSTNDAPPPAAALSHIAAAAAVSARAARALAPDRQRGGIFTLLDDASLSASFLDYLTTYEALPFRAACTAACDAVADHAWREVVPSPLYSIQCSTRVPIDCDNRSVGVLNFGRWRRCFPHARFARIKNYFLPQGRCVSQRRRKADLRLPTTSALCRRASSPA
jgi:hypothetical protein